MYADRHRIVQNRSPGTVRANIFYGRIWFVLTEDLKSSYIKLRVRNHAVLFDQEDCLSTTTNKTILTTSVCWSRLWSKQQELNWPRQAKMCLRACAKCTDSDSSYACANSHTGTCSPYYSWYVLQRLIILFADSEVLDQTARTRFRLARPKYGSEVKLHWLEHWWLVYRGWFELVFDSLRNSSGASRKQILKESKTTMTRT